MKRSIAQGAVVTFALVAGAPDAFAQEPVPEPAPSAPPQEPPPPPTPTQVKPVADPQRQDSAEPKPALMPPVKTRFDADPIVDLAITGVSMGFAGILDLINGTGEIRPQQVPQNFDRSKLISIDRGALSQTIDKNASTISNIGLFTAIGFAVLDPILSGFREDSLQAGLVDGIMYAEAISVTYAFTNLTKMAIRRPRPVAYLDAEAHKNDPSYSNSQTDSALSFFSGHASITATIGATATYLAFSRAKSPLRPWITLIVASAVSSLTSFERVRAGAHFPTDVIAGTVAGAGVGILVPHLHRSEDIKQRRVWVGAAPAPTGDGGSLQVSGLF
jgi:membrane-associated phospholipid phosphatase